MVVEGILLHVLLGLIRMSRPVPAFVPFVRCAVQLCPQAASSFWYRQLPSNAVVALVDRLHTCSFFNWTSGGHPNNPDARRGQAGLSAPFCYAEQEAKALT